jgi:exopolyphosphatase/guanosine-5'-triphosphate,3'-diphosphate pyrophosphatase
VRAIATSAARDAANGHELIGMLSRLGVELEIVDGSREAELAFRGATWDLRGPGLLVVDCGGGSTELVYGDAPPMSGVESEATRILLARSVDVGSRRMTERFFRSDPPTAGELEAARAWAAEELRGYFDRLEHRPTRVVGLAGTATSLASIHQRLEPYDPALVHGYELAGSDLSDLLEELSSMTLEQRRHVRGLHPERAGVIVAGALILETVLALAGCDRMTVSEHDLLYGILVDACPDLRERDR